MSALAMASIDGTISATAQARVQLPDDGLYRGDGVFEVIRLYAGRPFALADHLDRLERSGAAITLEFDRRSLAAEIDALVAAAGSVDAQLRLIVTRAGRRIALVEPLASHPDVARLTSVTYSPTGLLDRVKSLSYGANMQATRVARSRGADDAIFVTPDEVVLELPTATLFWVGADGVLRTPSLDLPILDSITRGRLIAELEVEEGVYRLADLHEAQEAFVASTLREAQPIARIDGRELATPGPRTLEAAAAIRTVVERELAAG